MSGSFPFTITNVFCNLPQNLRGNPSAVILLDNAIEAKVMQMIAKDLHQPATTFLWPTEKANEFEVRWFAPDAEIGLCGHGSLAAISFLSNQNEASSKEKAYNLISSNAVISGKKNDQNEYILKLDAIPASEEQSPPANLEKALGQKIVEYRKSNNKHIVLLENEQNVADMVPDFDQLRKIDVFGYAVTAASGECSFVSRTLVPHVQQLEDHATGSSHALLVPYWAKKLKLEEMVSKQLSPRGGYFKSKYENNTVTLIGQAYNSVEGTFLL